MNCKDCKDDMTEFDVNNPCKVCELVNKDLTHKKCRFCGRCRAYICKEHWDDAPARIEAAGINVVNAIVEVVRKVRGRKSKNNDTAETTA